MKITSEYYSAMQRALSWFFQEEGINLYEVPGARDNKDQGLEFGVNWSAHGTRPAAEAKDYAASLVKAANLCDKLNELKLVVDYSAPITLTQDERKDVVEGLIKALEGNCFMFVVSTYCTRK